MLSVLWAVAERKSAIGIYLSSFVIGFVCYHWFFKREGLHRLFLSVIVFFFLAENTVLQSSPVLAKYISVCLTFSTHVPLTLIESLMCLKLSMYLNALLAGVRMLSITEDWNLGRKSQHIRKKKDCRCKKKYKFSRLCYTIADGG